MKNNFYAISAITICLGLNACGSGSSNSDQPGVQPEPVSPYTASITYPTPGANLGGFVEETAVNLRFTANDGRAIDSNLIQSVVVNGLNATMSPDNSAFWSVNVPVESGRSSLEARVEFVNGSAASLQQSLQNEAVLHVPHNIVLDADSRTAYITDGGGLGELFVLDLRDASIRALSSHAISDQWQIESIAATAVDRDAQSLLILGQGRDGDRIVYDVYVIDLNSGQKAPLSDYLEQDIASFIGANDIVVDQRNDRLLISATSSSSGPATLIYSLDLETGNRQVFSSSSVGEGPAFNRPVDIVLTGASDIAYFVDGRLGLLSVDLSNGNRQLLYGADDLTDASFDPALNRLLLLNDSNQLIAYDIANQAVTTFVDMSITPTTKDIVVDPVSNQVLAVDLNGGHVVTVDLNSGEVSDYTEINRMESPNAIAIDGRDDRLVALVDGVTSNASDSIVRIDLAEGTRESIARFYDSVDLYRTMVFSPEYGFVLTGSTGISSLDFDQPLRVLSGVDRDNQQIGNGPELGFPTNFVMTSDQTEMFIAGEFPSEGAGLMKVDLATGNREFIANVPFLLYPGSVALDEQNNIVYAGSTQMIYKISLANAEVQRFSGSYFSDNAETIVIGDGARFAGLEDLVFDAKGERLLALDQTAKLIIAVNLQTGERSTVASTDILRKGANRFSTPSIMLDSDNRRLFFTDAYGSTLGYIGIVDLLSGSAAIVAK